jgi:Zn-dependent protease with chaperone function
VSLARAARLALVAGVLLYVGSPGRLEARLLAPAEGQQTAAAAAPQSAPRPVTAYQLPPDKQERAEKLYRIRGLLYVAGFVVGIGIPVLLLQLRIGPRYRDVAERASRRRIVQAIVFVPLLLLTMAVLSLPMDLYSQHVMRAYGLSVQGWGSWFGDWAKAQLVTYVIAVPMVLGLYAIVRRSPRRWWFYFWLLTIPVVIFIVFVTPVVLDPLFNTFEPLDRTQPQLVAPIQRVTARGGLDIPSSRMFEMKASEKVTTYNAYVTGLGATKRVVVWDNTARDMTVPETLFVFGHEMGHYVLGHVYKMLVFASAVLLACFWVGQKLVLWMLARWGTRWDVRQLGDWASLPALILALSIVTFAATPIFSAFSRHLEHQADIYGLEVTHGLNADSPHVAASAFQKLGEKALSYPHPNRLLVWWLYDHPTIAERVAFSLRYDPWQAPPGPAYVR